MDTQKPKIALYARRSVSETLNVSFDFIRENWKPVLKYTTYLMLPFCLIQGVTANWMMRWMGGLVANLTDPEISLVTGGVYYGLYMLLILAGSVLMASLVYGLLRIYHEREERLAGVDWTVLKPLLWHNVRRLTLILLFGIVLFVVSMTLIFLLAMLTPYTVIVTLPLLLAVYVPLMLWPVVCMFEPVPVTLAFPKALRLGFSAWGGVFAVLFVMGVVGTLLQCVTMMPWQLTAVANMMLSISDPGNGSGTGMEYGFVTYLFAVLNAFGGYLSTVFSIVGLTYQYGNACEKMEHVSVVNDIDNFDKL